MQLRKQGLSHERLDEYAVPRNAAVLFRDESSMLVLEGQKKNGIVDVLMMSVSDQMLKSSCLDKSEIICRILFVQRI